MKKVWKNALFSVLVSTALVSCGSGETEDSFQVEKAGDRHLHSVELQKKLDSIQPLFNDVQKVELYYNAKDKIDKWDSLWEVEFDKKYNN